MLSTFSLGENVMMETRDDGTFDHDEADITMVSYVIQAAKYQKNVTRLWSVMTPMCLSYWFIGYTEQHCSVRSKWRDGMEQY